MVSPPHAGLKCPTCRPFQPLVSALQPVPHLACTTCDNAVLPPSDASHLLTNVLGIDPNRRNPQIVTGPLTTLPCSTCGTRINRVGLTGIEVLMCSQCSTIWCPIPALGEIVMAAAARRPAPRRPTRSGPVPQRPGDRSGAGLWVVLGVVVLAAFFLLVGIGWWVTVGQPTFGSRPAAVAAGTPFSVEGKLSEAAPADRTPVGPAVLTELPFGGQTVEWWQKRLDTLARDPTMAQTYALTLTRVQQLGFEVDGGPTAHRLQPSKSLYERIERRSRRR